MVDPARIHQYNSITPTVGPVVYWMQRDQRVEDNWALIYAQEMAMEMKQPLMVVFNLVSVFLGSTIRQYGFMLKGLGQVESHLRALAIPFFLLRGDPVETLAEFLQKTGAGMLITDFNPVHPVMEWKRKLSGVVRVAFHEVDAHNIIPCRHISPKQEYAAFTLRKKVEQNLHRFLTDLPALKEQPRFPGELQTDPIDWDQVRQSLTVDRGVTEVDWLEPGERAAQEALRFFLSSRLAQYATGRNFPDRDGQSDLSPYLHFGHLSAQRVALAVRNSGSDPESVGAFLEELIVRRELADNFCLYTENYHSFDAFQPWARNTLNRHREDPREHLYGLRQLEHAGTHDPLWNAAQREMTLKGKMHGFMRMYWAKKILEWTASPEEAMAIAIYLNDKYELDGRDPNGYAGIAWAIGGTHDRPWGERLVFGMIRYMNYQGCKRKFNVDAYIKRNLR